MRRIGVIHASRENAAKALRSSGVVLVFPGGDYDAYRSTFAQNRIDFHGRKGYVRTAIEAGVPIVPAVSIGGQETQLFLTGVPGWQNNCVSSAYGPRSCRWPSASPSA